MAAAVAALRRLRSQARWSWSAACSLLQPQSALPLERESCAAISGWQRGLAASVWAPAASCAAQQALDRPNCSRLLLASPPHRPFSADADRRSGSPPPAHQHRQEGQHQADPARGKPVAAKAAPPAGAGAGQAVAVGWSRDEVVNLPNALSMLRLLSGPVIATWILHGQWSLALPALAVSAATDWADGYAARRLSRPSVIGSYLDPLADKVLIGCVVAALGASGTLPAPVVAVVVGRDVLLVAGAFAVRAKALGWRWPGAAEFFRVQSAAPAAPPAAGRSGSSSSGSRGSGEAEAAAAALGAERRSARTPSPAAPLVRPLYISKVNTVFQLGLVGACMMDAWLGWPGPGAVWAGSAATAGTTLWSSWAYLRAYQRGTLLAGDGPR